MAAGNTNTESAVTAISANVATAGFRANSQLVSSVVPGAATQNLTGIVPKYSTTKPAVVTGVVTTESGSVLVDSSGNPIISGGADPGIQQALSSTISKKVPSSYLAREDNPTPNKGVGNLDPVQTKALFTQIAYTESSFDYGVQGGAGNRYLGKYQMGAAALVDMGYIKADAYKQYGAAAIEYPNSLTGGLTSKDDFLRNASLQEDTMLKLAQRNYNVLVSKGAIKEGDDLGTVGGMIATAHLIGPGGAIKWRNSGEGADAFGTTGTAYFNRGRYAVNELAGKG